MSDATVEFPGGTFQFTRKKMKMGANFKALKGTFAAIALTGSDQGYVVKGTNSTNLLSIGRFAETKDNTGGAAGDVEVEVDFGREVQCLKAVNDTGTAVDDGDVGQKIYYKTNTTVTASATSTSIAGICWGFDSKGRVIFEPTSRFIPAASDASSVTVTDSGGYLASADVEGALEELAHSVGYVNVPITAAIDIATGALMAAFSNGASATPGTALVDSKTVGVRWNNHATPGAISVNVPMPEDLDDAENVVVHALVSKTGATLADATKLTIAAFEIVPGALHDADADMGGDTGAVTGDATAKTVTELTLTLTAANIHAAPSALNLQIKPKAGTLGTDDLVLHAVYLEYVRKNVAA